LRNALYASTLIQFQCDQHQSRKKNPCRWLIYRVFYRWIAVICWEPGHDQFTNISSAIHTFLYFNNAMVSLFLPSPFPSFTLAPPVCCHLFVVLFSSVYNPFALLGRKATFTHSLTHLLTVAWGCVLCYMYKYYIKNISIQFCVSSDTNS